MPGTGDRSTQGSPAKFSYPKGDPQNPLSWDELRAKYRELGRSVLPEDRLDEICQSVQCLESAADVAPIWRRLRPTVGPDA